MYFITFTTGSYNKITENFLINFQRILTKYGHHLILICVDEIASEYFQKYKNEDWLILDTRNCFSDGKREVLNYKEKKYNILCSLKPQLVKEYLTNSYDELFYIDTDIIFYKDPTSYINNCELIFQKDGENTVCAGCFYIKRTPRTLKLLELWIWTINKGENTGNDQDYLIVILNDIFKGITSIPGIRGDYFPAELFQRGCDAIEKEWWMRDDKICIHVNWRVGLQTKIEALKRINEWYLN